jgi:hypothetical protein
MGEMIRKSILAGVLGMAAMLAVAPTGARQRIVQSAGNFQQYFQDLKGARGSLSPVERFVFSVVLATTNQPHAEK